MERELDPRLRALIEQSQRIAKELDKKKPIDQKDWERMEEELLAERQVELPFK